VESVIFSLFGGDWRIGRARVRPVDKVLFDTLTELSAVQKVLTRSHTPHDEPPGRALSQWAGLSEEIDKEFKEAGYVIWSEDRVSQPAD
jgi:hypothetical protein